MLHDYTSSNGEALFTTGAIMERTALAVVLGVIIGVGATMFLLKTATPPAAPPGRPTEVTSLPPEQFTGGGFALVRFVPPYMITDFCGDNAIACADATNGTTITILNPCALSYSHPLIRYRQRNGRPPAEVYESASEFSNTLCHELGHINGWDHGDGPITANYPGEPRE